MISLLKRTSPGMVESLEPRCLLAVIPALNDQILVAGTDVSSLLLLDPGGAATIVNGPDVPLDHPQMPALSPDRTQIVFVTDTTVDSRGAEIQVINVDGTGLVALTKNLDEDIQPRFSPDGSKIVFTSGRDGNEEIYVMVANGTDPVRLTNNALDDESPSFSPDGSKIIWDSNRDGDYEIYSMDAGTGANVQQLTNNAFDDLQATFSPEGGQIAFVSDRASGHDDIWAMNADGSSPLQITELGTADRSQTHPTWSPDGAAIAFEVDDVNGSHVEIARKNPGPVFFPLTQNIATPSWASAPAFGGIYRDLLTLNGTSAADNFTFNLDPDAPGTLQVVRNGQTESFNLEDFDSINIFCGAGNDTVVGDANEPRMYVFGDSGDDLLIGGIGNDTLSGGSGRNTLFGGDGDDRLNGSGGRDFLYGDAGNDRMYGNAGNDYMLGGSGVDRMWGGAGDDLLSGNSGNDKMYGEAGNDLLLGGDGNDLVYGGTGIDTCNGGKGTDGTDYDTTDDVWIAIEVVPPPP